MSVTEQQQRFEVIAAFADGERVDTRALRDALADEAGRDHLIDLVALREVVAGTTGATGATGATGTTGARRRWIGLAAAAVIAVGAAGYAVGQQRSRVVTVAAHPPLEADVVVSVEAAPRPTQVIRLGSDAPGGGR